MAWQDKPGIRLRLVEQSDSELMRLWKNANKLFFFTNETFPRISSATGSANI